MSATAAQVAAVQQLLGCAPGPHVHVTDPIAPVTSVDASWDERGCSFAASVADAASDAGPRALSRWEYGVERPWGTEWGASVGMSHHYAYTKDSVHARAGGKPVWRRLRTSYSDVLGEPELFPAGSSSRDGA